MPLENLKYNIIRKKHETQGYNSTLRGTTIGSPPGSSYVNSGCWSYAGHMGTHPFTSMVYMGLLVVHTDHTCPVHRRLEFLYWRLYSPPGEKGKHGPPDFNWNPDRIFLQCVCTVFP